MRKSILFLFLAAAVLASVPAAFAADKPLPPVGQPIIVTTCGQSPGAVMVKMSCVQAKLAAEHNNKLAAADLKGKGYKTLIVTTGTSMKGMGAAGTNVDTEVKRVKELIAEAKKQGMLVVAAHVEGMSRRVDKADQSSIDAVLPDAGLILVVNDSDKDGYFTKYAAANGKPLLKVTDALGIGAGLKKQAK